MAGSLEYAVTRNEWKAVSRKRGINGGPALLHRLCRENPLHYLEWPTLKVAGVCWFLTRPSCHMASAEFETEPQGFCWVETRELVGCPNLRVKIPHRAADHGGGLKCSNIFIYNI